MSQRTCITVVGEKDRHLWADGSYWVKTFRLSRKDAISRFVFRSLSALALCSVDSGICSCFAIKAENCS